MAGVPCSLPRTVPQLYRATRSAVCYFPPVAQLIERAGFDFKNSQGVAGGISRRDLAQTRLPSTSQRRRPGNAELLRGDGAGYPKCLLRRDRGGVGDRFRFGSKLPLHLGEQEIQRSLDATRRRARAYRQDGDSQMPSRPHSTRPDSHCGYLLGAAVQGLALMSTVALYDPQKSIPDTNLSTLEQVPVVD